MTFTYGGTSVVLPGAFPQTPLPAIEHSQNIGETVSGFVRVYNRGVNRWYPKIKMQLNATQRSALRAFVKNTIQFSTLYFTVTPDATVDLGRGAGVALTNVYWWEDTYSEVPLPGQALFEVSFVLRTVSTGTSDPA